MDQPTQDTSKLKVFVSYSRKDLEFADQLVAILQLQGFEPIIDRKGIHGAENWKDRLGQLILQGDIVVFVLSPDSARSDICGWEVEEATRRGKRIIPIICRPLDGATPHENLRDLNYIHFYPEKDAPGSGFGTGSKRLIDALTVDVSWLREHTRLEELAARWDAKGRPQDQLARGSELKGYQNWRDNRPPNATPVTALQRAFLTAGQEAETVSENAERKQLDDMKAAQAERTKALEESEAAQKRLAHRTLIGMATAAALLLVAALAGVYAFIQTQHLKTAEQNLDLREGHFQARAAADLLKDNRPVDAALIALEGMLDNDSENGDGPYVSQVSGALINGLRHMRERQILWGHSDAVSSATFSPDGTHILTASEDNTARVWDATTGAEIVHLKGHGDTIKSAVWSPDGTRIVTALDDTTARVWDAASGDEIAQLKGHGSAVRSAVFSPDGSRIVTASDDKTVRVWDAASGDEIAQLKGHRAAVISAAFSPDGTRIVTASWDSTARVWDSASGDEIAQLKGHDGRVKSAVFSPDGTRIVTASGDNTTRVWDATSGDEIAQLKGHGDAVSSAAFSPDGSRIVTASDDKTVRVWDAASGAEIAQLKGHDNGVSSAAYSPDGTIIVTASYDKTTRLWDAVSGDEIAQLKGHGGGVTSAAFSPDGKRIVTASWDRTARIWLALKTTQAYVDLAKKRVPRCLTK